ncbi:MAG: hypothetical protein J6O18_10900 [Bacilli bacterium]|nr:hypothetical protein [Bacilli bacterium]
MGKFAAFLGGFFVGVLTLAGGVAIAAAVVPSKTYLNATGTQIVGDKIGEKGLFDVISNVNTYTIEDVPVIKGLLDNILAEGGLGDLVTLDYEEIKTIRFTDPQLSEKLKKAMKITATLEKLSVDLGSFGNLSAFKDWTPITPTAEEIDSNYKAYYFKNDAGEYLRAYDDSKNYANGYQTGGQLYLPKLSAIPVMELFNGLSVRLGELTYKDFMVGLMNASEADLQNDTVYKLIGNAKLSELKNLDTDEFQLTNIVAVSSNERVYDLLRDLTGAEHNEDIKLGMLSNLDVGNARLTSVIKYQTSTKALYDILLDITGKDDYETLKVSDLDNVDLNNVKLATVLKKEDAKDNAFLTALLSKEDDQGNPSVTLGNLGDTINTISVYDLFGEKCFTTDKTEAIASRINDTYRLGDDGVFTYDTTLTEADKPYYISATANVWLILSYDSGDIDNTNGRARTYAPSTISYKDLQGSPGGSEKTVSEKIGEAKIYQLISAGVLEGDFNDSVTRLSLSEALGMVP